MAEVIQKRKIVNVVQFSAQSEQLCEIFTLNAIGFLKKCKSGTRAPRAEILLQNLPEFIGIIRTFR